MEINRGKVIMSKGEKISKRQFIGGVDTVLKALFDQMYLKEDDEEIQELIENSGKSYLIGELTHDEVYAYGEGYREAWEVINRYRTNFIKEVLLGIRNLLDYLDVGLEDSFDLENELINEK